MPQNTAEAAVKCAKEAVKGYENKYIAYDIGPTGRLIKPMGNMEFEEAVSIFKECTEYAVKLRSRPHNYRNHERLL